MRDRVMMVLAFFGFVVIAIITVLNWDTTQDEKIFSVGSFYVPNNVKSSVTDSAELVAQMTGSRMFTCPVTEMSKTTSKYYSLTELWRNSQVNTYYAYTFPITTELPSCTGTSYQTNLNSFVDSTLASQMGLISGADIKTPGETEIGSLYDFGDSSYCEIIAPFNFKFANVNTIDNDEIIIVNTTQTCRITFGNVANWFCAGPIGTSQTLSDGTDSDVIEWDQHGDYHNTIVGSSTNAEVSGGSLYDVIGYASEQTTIKIEEYDGSWKTISIYTFLTSRSTK